ncbi:hypothetical protein [Cellulosimicrobium arenosum]|uniref:Uncharacterized protein n=1 Tax=Cellulosimicrobium arenosum TaxID=2708133 RepID=A0A927IZH1_9MICO|nr:hypothetical protein [Cellulosimicrobium arenosum]MBD8078535.1 hypothetical protein [Cellulosimicrobium arenosum]
MTLVGYLLCALAGALAMNGLLHVVKGGTGRRHTVPWAPVASAPVNVLWGAANWLLAIWVGVWAATFHPWLPLALTWGLVLGTAFVTFLAAQWQADPVARGEIDS